MNYVLNLLGCGLHQVSKAEFDRMRKMVRLFKFNPNKPTRLRLKDKFYAWIEDGKAHFAEKDPGNDRSRSLLVDSVVLMERSVAPHHPSYIQDPVERQLAIEAQYL